MEWIKLEKYLQFLGYFMLVTNPETEACSNGLLKSFIILWSASFETVNNIT